MLKSSTLFLQILALNLSCASALRHSAIHTKANGIIYRQELHNYRNVIYDGDIKIGGQIFDGIFDTGSFDLLVVSSDCKNGGHACQAVLKYDDSKSSTFKEHGVEVEHCYGSGCADTELGFDRVEVGPLSIAQQAFWQITGHEMSLMASARFQAIVGISMADSPSLNTIAAVCKVDNIRLKTFAIGNATEGNARGQAIRVPGNGTAEDFSKLDVAGKVAIILRGNITFQTKCHNAKVAGAIACVIVNDVDEDPMGFTFGEVGDDDMIPSVAVGKSDGSGLAGKDLSISVYVLQQHTMVQNLKIPEFAFCFEKRDGSPGWIYWGSQPELHDQMAHINVASPVHWLSNMTNIGFLSRDGSFAQLDVCKPSCGALIDSGTSLIVVPEEDLKQIHQIVGKVPEDCSGIDALPTLRIKLDDHVFELLPQAYVVQTHFGGPTTKLKGVFGFQQEVQRNTVCRLGFMPHSLKSIWIFGAPWFRHYYTIFDRENKRMLVAPAMEDCRPGQYNLPSSNATPTHFVSNKLMAGQPMKPVFVDFGAARNPWKDRQKQSDLTNWPSMSGNGQANHRCLT